MYTYSLTDFNHLKKWLDRNLRKRRMTIEDLSKLTGISRASLYFYRQDVNRPEVGTMARICEVLGVPLEEGLQQYTPKPRGKMDRSESRKDRLEKLEYVRKQNASYAR